jgi:hypothetical protein
MTYQGVLKKMMTSNENTVQYYLDMDDDFLNMNQLLDREIELSFVKYECLSCHKDKQIYRQGFCKNCFFESPNAGEWIINPEKSTAHLGIEDRDLEFEKKMQLMPHIVYLANSSDVKVGVTRKSQVPTRWIDQGAHEAIEIVEVPNRYLAGITEVVLKDYVSDKTNWRKMLTNDITDVDLVAKKEELSKYIPEEVKAYYLDKNDNELQINFPVNKYPEKVKSLNLVKVSNYKGVLKGIKGQYLIFEDSTVFNIRANEGLVVKMTV